jgi:hypothetical protein
MAGAFYRHSDTKDACRVLFEKPQKGKPLVKGRRWWDDIKGVLTEIVCEDMNWTDLKPVTGLSRNHLFKHCNESSGA